MPRPAGRGWPQTQARVARLGTLTRSHRVSPPELWPLSLSAPAHPTFTLPHRPLVVTPNTCPP